MAEYDIIVVGAGVAGLSAAAMLADSARVLVVEAEDSVAYHASGRSAAVYIQGYENDVVADLTADGWGYFSQPVNDLVRAPILKPLGGLTVGRKSDAAEVDDFVSTWQSRCPNLTRIDPDEAMALLPGLRETWAQAACYDPDWQAIDVHELLQSYQRKIRAAGGSIECGASVASLRFREGRWWVGLGGRELSANVVVNAAGAWAGAVGAMAGLVDVPLQPMRRTAVLLPPPEGAQRWPLTKAADWSLYFKPEGNGVMVSPVDEQPSPPMDAFAHELDIAMTVARFEAVTTFNVQRVQSSWAGLRTFAPDRQPLVGWDPRASGFFWLAGQGGFGVQTSPGLAMAVAANILQGTALPAGISVERFMSL